VITNQRDVQATDFMRHILQMSPTGNDNKAEVIEER